MLLSTMHHTDEIDPDSGEPKKPYMLMFYNSTNGVPECMQLQQAETL